jgi:putative DNA primase/helicase
MSEVNSMSVLPAVPALFKAMPNWVAWKLVDDTKPPFVVGTDFKKKAASNDPSTWTDFSTAILKTTINGSEGIGFVIGGDAIEKGIVGLDIDGCRDPRTGKLTPWADELVELVDSYTEITPSGKGVRVWCIGEWPFSEHVYKLDFASGIGDKVQIEVYRSGRYFTVTGNSFHESPNGLYKRDLAEARDLCLQIQKKYPFGAKAEEKEGVADPEVVRGVQIEKRGSTFTSKLELLSHGAVQPGSPTIITDQWQNSLTYPSHSEADLALCTELALKYGDDVPKIWDGYLQSNLCREKWTKRESYFKEHTIAKAIATAARIMADANTGTPLPATISMTATNPVPLWDRATAFCDIDDVPMEWIVPGLIVKCETTMMTGDFGSFKSYMTYLIADAISEGGMFVRRPVQRHPVLVLDRENSKSTISLRRYLVGNLREKNNVKLLGRFTVPPAPEITDSELLLLCKTIHPFVIIDSMQDFHPGKKENDTDDMTQFSLEVNRLIDAGAVGVLIIHHVPKTGRDKGRMYRGTTAIPGGVGGALFVEKVKQVGVKISGFKTRDGEDSLVELLLKFPSESEIKDKTGRVTYSIARAGMDRSAELISSVVDFVRTANAKNVSPTANQIAKGLGGDRNEIYGLVDRLTLDRTLIPNDPHKKGGGGLKVASL